MKQFFLSKTFAFSFLFFALFFGFQLNTDGLQVISILNLLLVSLICSSAFTFIVRLFKSKRPVAN
ncbi:hypothetical protein DTQ03_10640 [Bacillus subtilis]|nr:hypothetical protein DTQ03_10640 [Bacillus subtilis]CAF1782186.1 hypothetical protein NRS6111_03861 [Bacillus subtilis]